MHRIVFAIGSSILLVAASFAGAEPPVPNRPEVPGKLRLTLRTRTESSPAGGKVEVVERVVDWNVSETAIIICDMWDDHYCKLAAQRVAAMVPKMNRTISAARERGVQIIHAPSGTMDVYDKTLHRLRMKQTPRAKPPVPIAGWCYHDPTTEAEMPVDVANEPCDDPVVGDVVRRYTRQHAGLAIIGYDGISHDGQEIYNFLVANGIRNVVIMGVHTNMCVLGRPFGIRQMTRLGMNVALARDLTDAMYDPRDRPYVSHKRGTELVIEHIERYWCPSLASGDLITVVPGSDDPRPTPAKDAPAPR